EFFILAHVRSDHLLDLAGAQQLAQAKAVDAGIVAEAGKVLNARIPKRRDQGLGDAAEAEAANRNGLAVGNDALQRFFGACIDFIHYSYPYSIFRAVASDRKNL